MRRLLVLTFLSISVLLSAQDQGRISGDVMMNNSFFMRDSARNAFGTPQYNRQLFGTDGWMSLKYDKGDFSAGIRFDMHNNSNLHSPLQSFTSQGIGRWFIKNKMDKLTVTAGFIYDQFGNGITFRAFEERALGLDNAIYGIHGHYMFTDNIEFKGFAGRQKNRFELFEPFIKGANLSGSFNKGEVYYSPGFSWVNRTLDDNSMNSIVNSINGQAFDERFVPVNNVYLASMNHSLNYKNLTWDMELAMKTGEALFIQTDDGQQKYEWRDGTVIFQSVTYAKKGLGLTGQYKRTENYSFRVSPTETGLRGVINYLPPLTRQNSYRLPARYAAQSLELSEQAVQLDGVFKISKRLSGTANVSHVTDLEGELKFRELYAEFKWKVNKKWKVKPGFQYLQLDMLTYGLKGTGLLTSVTPFVEVAHKMKKRRSIRGELSMMQTEQDFGSWSWILLEYTMKSWSFSVSDMYNFAPTDGEDLHYPTVFASYAKKSNRYTLAYVKQVEGIVCTGGVCRYEPAFSGVRLTLNSNF